MKNSKLVLDEDTARFLQELKTLREKAGFTREKAAQIIGITVDTLSHYENLSRLPSVKIFTQLAALFSYDMSRNINYKFYSGQIDYLSIRTRIRALGLTKAALAELTKYSIQSITAVINQHRESSPACLFAVLNVLGIQL